MYQVVQFSSICNRKHEFIVLALENYAVESHKGECYILGLKHS